MSLQCLQQLTGANYFFYYGATIFQSVGIDDSYVTQIILGSVNFGCTFGGLYVMERVRTMVCSRYPVRECTTVWPQKATYHRWSLAVGMAFRLCWCWDRRGPSTQ